MREDVGERLRLRGRIEPIDIARNAGEPSPRELAADEGIEGELTHVTVIARAPPDDRDVRTWMPRLRAAASASLRAHLAEPFASILAGALWGERSTLPGSLHDEFQTTGTVHVLVTAGLHLGVVAALALGLMRLVGIPRMPAALVTLVVVWFYVWFSGAHLPSLRAGTMLSVALVARACGERAVSWNVFAIATIAISLAWPAAVGSASFALSFSCVGAILLFADPIAGALERARIPSLPGEAIALTAATQIGVWPLTAAIFLVATPYAMLANVAVVPVIGVAMALGFAQLLTAPCAPLADAIACADSWILAFVVAVVRAVASLPYARIDLVPPSLACIFAYDALAVLAALAIRSERPRIATIVLAVAFVLVAFPRPIRDGTLHIDAIDVGQADALLIRTPDGHAIMVDTGGKLERGADEDGGSPAEAVGERVVVPALLRTGITSLDGLIITHPHGDHVGGCAPILRHLHVGWIADSGQRYPGRAYHDCLDEASRRHVSIREPRRGDVWRTSDGIVLRFLGPSNPYFTDERNDVNENSIVFMLEYQRFRVLFMGDAGAEAEARILASGTDVHADVLKVGHHGSAYSSTPAFIRAVSPGIAVISVGRHNLFGHPAPETIDTLESSGARVYRTDRCGEISLVLRERAQMHTMIPCTR